MLDPTPIRRRKRLWALALGVGTLLIAMGLATRGLQPSAPSAVGAAALLHVLLTSGMLALAYLLSGVGLGAAVLRRMCPQSAQKAWLALAVGPGLMLFLCHGMGVLGLLSGAKGQWVAGGTLGLGLGLLLWELIIAVRGRPNLSQPPACSLLWIAPAAVIVVAACNPPGWLWESEANGYDVLSYHLQLPQEWAMGERLWPLKHNVYSFLPGYVESGYLHVAALMGAGRPAPATEFARGLVAYDGLGAAACQLIHAGFGLISAILAARVIFVLLLRAGLSSRLAAEVGALGGAVLLATPWVVVVSSMAYNESAVNAMFAGALLVVLDAPGGLPAGRRGLLAGLLVGLATACKPTAAFLVAPTIGLLLLTGLERRVWMRAAALGALAGLAMVVPCFIRNALAGGNPIFPAGAAWFGRAHWSAEQVARFASAHQESSTLPERIGLLLAFFGARAGQQPRGVFHEQWHALFPVGVAALVVAGLWRPLAGPARGLAIGLGVSLAWWLFFSHCQSRFLLPAAVPLAVATGLCVGRLADLWQRRLEPNPQRLAMIVVGAFPLVLAAASVRIFLGQHRAGEGASGFPNYFLAEGSGYRSGERLRGQLPTLGAQDREAILAAIDSEAFVNVTIPDRKVYLIGGATPFYYTPSLMHHTTWDPSPLAMAIRAARDQPALWSENLRSRGIEFVLIDFMELSRLERDGWIDPDVKAEAVITWAMKYCEPVRYWSLPGPDANSPGAPLRGLFRLTPMGPSGKTL